MGNELKCECGHPESDHFLIRKGVPDRSCWAAENELEVCDCGHFRPEPTAALVKASIESRYNELIMAVESKHPNETRHESRYNELIMAVESKHPNETRHETALRYIREAETPSEIGSIRPPTK